jgi:hypothetical protein
MLFFGLSRQIPGMFLKLEHDSFLSHPFQFIILYDSEVAMFVFWVITPFSPVKINFHRDHWRYVPQDRTLETIRSFTPL